MDDRDAVGMIDNTDLQRSPFADGPMNIVTSASSVSKPRQWCRSAWSMSWSETPCLRALTSMPTWSSYALDCVSSTYVDESL